MVSPNSIDVVGFLRGEGTSPILDVRSPSEFAHGHIPGAVSFPLFSDEERAIVGTTYKQKGQQQAVKIGLEITGPKMVDFITKAEVLGSKSFRVHCWRGGMRSESVSWLLQQYGFETQLLEGGYKAYRQELLRYFSEDLPLRVVTGYTGSGKTRLLHELASAGEQVIDLEGYANHQGSSFGNQNCDEQPTTEQFQNDLFDAFMKLDQKRTIWLEDESICIGRVSLPEPLFTQMNASPHVQIDVQKSIRIENLMRDYGQIDKAKLAVATRSITKKLGHKKAEAALGHIEVGEMQEAASIILTYYDSSYRKSVERKAALIEGRYACDGIDFSSLTPTLIEDSLCLSN